LKFYISDFYIEMMAYVSLFITFLMFVA